VRELESALRARDDFLAIAAHELRTPLHSMALRLSMLERLSMGSADPRLRDEIRRTRRSADRFVGRAAILLDVARLNSGQLEPMRSSVSIRTLVEDVLEVHRDEANSMRSHCARRWPPTNTAGGTRTWPSRSSRTS